MKKTKNKICKSLHDKISDTRGFTLVELIVVLVIIAILAAAIGPAFLGYIDKVKKNNTLNDAKKIYLAAESLSQQAYNDLVLPSARVTKERISEMSGVTFKDGEEPYTIVYVNSSFDNSNPTKAMYTINKFSYSDGTFTASYDKNSVGADGEIWTVTEN